MPSLDVVIPNYQYGRYLSDAVGSVLRQDVDGLRILIIDNASTDDSVQIARRIAADEPRVEVLARSVNQGFLASFNAGVEWAKADYFMLLCADDLLVPGLAA